MTGNGNLSVPKEKFDPYHLLYIIDMYVFRSLACNNWYFGTNCSTECNCLVEPCNKVDGICPFGGCKEGWHGESCNQSKKLIFEDVRK